MGAVLLAGGCTTVVPGSAAPVTGSAGPTPPIDPTAQEVEPGPSSGLEADVLPDECLLTAAELGELVGEPVRPPEQGTVDRGDGSRSASCVAAVGAEPVALVNVYAVPSGTPADYVRTGGSGGRRELAGVGEAAVVIGTAAGPTLQLAGERYLVTILVSGRAPSDAEWRAAAEAALSRLPG